MKRAVESFEDDRGPFAGGARRALAAGLVVAALSLMACDRSKVVIELNWETGAITEDETILIEFKDLTKPETPGTPQQTTDGGRLPPTSPLTLVYWVDDPNKKINVKVSLVKGMQALVLYEQPWDGNPIKVCITCLVTHPDGGADTGPDADGGPGGAAAGGHPGTGGAASGGAGGVGGAMNMMASGGAGGQGGGGKGGAPNSSNGGSKGEGGKGGVSISPIGGSNGQGGVIGVGGIISIGGNPGTGGVGTGGSATGGTASGGTASGGTNGTGGIVGTGGTASSGGATGSGGAPAPSCLTDTAVPCTCDDYCDALTLNCSKPPMNFGYFLPGVMPTRDDCVKSCAGFRWNPGTNDPSTFPNTIGCRVAQTEALRCTAASPTGGGVCGGRNDMSRCRAYCDALDSNCANDLHPFPNGDCMVLCASSPLGWEKTMEKLSTTSTAASGNSGNCRLYWAGQAGTSADKITACKNAGPESTVCQ